MNEKLIMYSAFVAVVINLVLPAILKPLATKKQIKPPNGVQNLSFFDKMMHMFVHHAQVPIASSIIVIIIVVLSLFLGEKISKFIEKKY